MGKFRYVTNRIIQNKAGKEAGKLRACVLSGSETAEVDYVCPECQKSEHIQQIFKRPLNVKCTGCGFLIRASKMKDEIKREKKKARL